MEFYRWQKDALARISGRDAVVSAPTGSGKTVVAYMWAGLMDGDGQPRGKSKDQRIIFTAPIKALSNERYLDLKKFGFNVGIETGDFKRNTDAEILCCTQEIYTQKYAGQPGLKVIIDEFHYVSTDPRRARAYIDGVRNTHPSSKILLMSATFGHPERLQKYLKNLTGRNFELYTTSERATEQVFLEEPVEDLGALRDALVFVFSYRGVMELAQEIADSRDYLDSSKEARLNELARCFRLTEVPDFVYKGVGAYTGSMLPKEKLFMERAYRERIIDVMVGTDALSLGVNLPAETVVFAQLAKYYDGPISKNEFLQMAGRAGRKGYFDTGYITYYPSGFESFEYDTGELYEQLLAAPEEQINIQLVPSFPDILRGKPVEEEAEYVAKFSYPPLSRQEVLDEINRGLQVIEEYIEQYVESVGSDKFKRTLADVYYPEYSLFTNLELASLFVNHGLIDVHDVINTVFSSESNIKNEFYGILQVKRYINSLSAEYRERIKDKQFVDEYINAVDPTVAGFEEILSSLDGEKQKEELFFEQNADMKANDVSVGLSGEIFDGLSVQSKKGIRL